MLLLLVSIAWQSWLLECQPRWGKDLLVRTGTFICRWEGVSVPLLLQVWTDLHHTGFLPFVANPLSSMNHMIRYSCSSPPFFLPNLFITYNNFLPVCNLCTWHLSLISEPCYSCDEPSCSFHSAEGMNAGGYGNLLMSMEQPQGEYSVTISFLNLVTTLVRVSASGMLWCDTGSGLLWLGSEIQPCLRSISVQQGSLSNLCLTLPSALLFVLSLIRFLQKTILSHLKWLEKIRNCL